MAIHLLSWPRTVSWLRHSIDHSYHNRSNELLTFLFSVLHQGSMSSTMLRCDWSGNCMIPWGHATVMAISLLPSEGNQVSTYPLGNSTRSHNVSLIISVQWVLPRCKRIISTVRRQRKGLLRMGWWLRVLVRHQLRGWPVWTKATSQALSLPVQELPQEVAACESNYR